MREFRKILVAAIIVGFKGQCVVTDDEDLIEVGDPWLAQNSPKPGDAICKDGMGWAHIPARQLADYEMPVAEPEVEPTAKEIKAAKAKEAKEAKAAAKLAKEQPEVVDTVLPVVDDELDDMTVGSDPGDPFPP